MAIKKRPDSFIILAFILQFIVSRISLMDDTINLMLNDGRYDEVLDLICPIRPESQCFAPLETYLNGSGQIKAATSHAGYSSTIHNHNDLFAVKLITVDNPEMLFYTIHEINTGIMIKESLTQQAISNLVPIEQCCSQRLRDRKTNKMFYKFFIRIPYYPLGSLRSLMENEGNMHLLESMVWCWNVIDGLIKGIGAIHSRQYIHRDIKPENVLMKSYYTPQISDFGFAKRVVETTDTILGTITYIAPEIPIGESYNHKVDIFSLGVVIFEILTCGKYNIKERGREGIELFCENMKPSGNSNLDYKTKIYCNFYSGLVASMLEENPSKRPDIEQVSQEFEAKSNAWLSVERSENISLFEEEIRDLLVDVNTPFRKLLDQNKKPAI